MTIVLITASLDYADYLTFALRAASMVVDRGYVVTDHDDASIGVADELKAVPLVYGGWRANGAKFNKAGAVRHAQQIAYAEYPDAWYLLLDADCILQVGAREIIEQHATDDSCLYGARRVEFPDIESLQAGRPNGVYSSQFAGFFQLYRRHVLYPEWSYSAEACDHAFAQQFAASRVLPLTVGHCGQARVNWEGRVSPPWVHGCMRAAITSENPAEHWLPFDVRGGTVLDLGCGYNDDEAREHGWSTPAHWIAGDAVSVVGVDVCADDIARLEQETPCAYHCEPVSVELVQRYMPVVTHIKSDCEGGESELFAVPLTPNIKSVSVECHTPPLIALCRQWVIEGGLRIVAERPLSHRPDIVVITAVRP